MAASTIEVLLKFTGDPRNAKDAIAQVRADLTKSGQEQVASAKNVNKQVATEAKNQTGVLGKEERDRNRTAETLQRQRSAALITIWKADTRAAANEEKRRTADAAREERERTRAALSLQRQRSAALIAQWRAEQREQVRIAREAAREAELARTTRGGSTAFLAGAAGGLSALIGVSAISEIRQAASAWLDYSSKLETTRIAFTTMLGSAQAANDHLKELEQFALKTPFQFSELIDASQRMQALGFNASQVVPILTDVGNAVAAAGGGSERLDRVVLAISQIQSKGKVATQELNQLAEAGISGFKILEQALGKSRAELVKLVEAGEISSKTFLDAFQKFSQVNFGGLMEAQSRTFTGAMSNIKDALLQTSAVAFEPLFKRLSETARHFSEASQSSEDFKKKAQEVGKVVSTIWDGAVLVTNAFKDAIRLAVTVIVVELEKLVNGFEAVAHAIAAVFFHVAALAKAMQGDFLTAGRFQEESIRQLRLSHDALGKALTAEIKIIQEIAKVYNEAGAAAKRLKDERAGLTVGGDVGGEVFQRQVGGDVGGEVFRKKAGGTTTDTEADKKTKGSDPAAAAKRIAEIQLRAVLDGLKLEEDAIERSLRRREIGYAEYVVKLELLEGQRSRSVVAALIDEQKAADKLRDANARAVATAEITARLAQERNRHQSELNKLADKTFEREKQIHDTLTEFREEQIEQLRQLTDGNKTALDQVDDFIAAYTKLGGVLDANQIHWLRFNAALIESKENVGKLLAAIREAAELVPSIAPEGVPIPEQVPIDIGLPPPPDISPWKTVFAELKAVGMDALSSLALGVGSLVEQWVILGSQAGVSIRKLVASVLAGVAAQAAVLAVMELAYAIAALTPWGAAVYGPASAHFKSAALFGSIALGAGLAGRAAAGNSFQSQSAGGGGGSAGGTSTPAPLAPTPVNMDRATQNQQAITVLVKVQRDAGSIVEAVVESHRDNGPIRQMILSER